MASETERSRTKTSTAGRRSYLIKPHEVLKNWKKKSYRRPDWWKSCNKQKRSSNLSKSALHKTGFVSFAVETFIPPPKTRIANKAYKCCPRNITNFIGIVLEVRQRRTMSFARGYVAATTNAEESCPIEHEDSFISKRKMFDVKTARRKMYRKLRITSRGHK